MYILIVLLHKEARLLPTQLKMVIERKLRRYQLKKETQGTAAQEFRIVGQVQWRRDTEEVRQYLQRPVMIWHKEYLTIHWLCICCVILSTYGYNTTEMV
jgi:hypothetical protein